MRALDDLRVARPDAEGEAPARHGLRGERLGGEGEGVARVRRDDGGAHLDAGHLASGERRGHEGVPRRRVPEEEAVEPGVPGEAGLGDEIVHGAIPATLNIPMRMKPLQPESDIPVPSE